MEVAQIGRVIALKLSGDPQYGNIGIIPSPAQIEAICLAHDLGHPAFGHCGEVALNHAMRDDGGFESNGQSLRIISRLEPHTPGFGLNLTRRTLLGTLKYPASYLQTKRTKPPPATLLPNRHWKPPKCFLNTECEVVNWIIEALGEDDRVSLGKLDPPPTAEKAGKTRHRSFDTSILNLADDIAYNVHDLEDGIALGLVSKDQFLEKIDLSLLDWARPFGMDPTELVERLFGAQAREGSRNKATGFLLNALICSVEIHTVNEFTCPLLDHCAVLPCAADAFLKAAHQLIFDRIINSQEVQTLEYRGMKIISDLFHAIASDPETLLGETGRKRLDSGADTKNRIVCDFIAGMTDVYANRFHERLYGSRQASVFERL